MKLEYLAWDSDFFKKKIGRIQLLNHGLDTLSSAIRQAKNENYDLVYVFSPENILIDNELLSKLRGTLVDRKIIYRQTFKPVLDISPDVEDFNDGKLTKDLEELAYKSGIYSRFYLDKNFAHDDFYRLYYTWISKSVTGELADNVYVIRESDVIVGMVTLKSNENSGEIGLLAVSELTRGKGYGKKLIDTCKKVLSNVGIFVLDVPTQYDNKQACSFYEKCGFQKLSITNIYHFWS